MLKNLLLYSKKREGSIVESGELDLSRHFACEGELLRNEYSRDLCRTQVVLRLPDQAFRYFLTDPIGNHHVIFPGHCAAALEELLK